MELVLIAGVVSIALGAVGFWWWLSDEQVAKRKIKSAAVVRIAEAKEGDLIKIVGRLAFDEDVQLLEGPLTGRRCVGYHVEVLEKHSRGKSSLSDAPERTEAFLARHGTSSEGVLGQAMRYTEGVLQATEEVAVLGVAKWELDPDPTKSQGYRGRAKRLVMCMSDDGTMIISDDPSTLA
jgi:hypothetical protein